MAANMPVEFLGKLWMGAAPWPILWKLSQAFPHRVVMDVSHNSDGTFSRSHLVIVEFALPWDGFRARPTGIAGPTRELIQEDR